MLTKDFITYIYLIFQEYFLGSTFPEPLIDKKTHRSI
jgi:hypothetical protein